MTLRCESCGMPIESGRYCVHCVDETGELQEFETRFERMVAWAMRRDTSLTRAEAGRKTIAYMSGMPVCRGHPSVTAGRAPAP
jgi:hypothetical protein